MTDGPRTATTPDTEQACGLVSDGIEAGALVTLFGHCTVDYEGRAASTLGPGDRLVVLKPDGTALVHTDEGQQPVNWQPPGCAHSVSVDGDALVIRSERETPEELLVVRFESVDHAALFDPTDPSDLSLVGTEADLRDRILSDPALVEDGFEPRATERETPAGAVDIYGEDADGTAVVVELKRRRVGPDAVGQLTRYVDALERDLHAGREVRGILVAPSVTDRARRLLAERGLEFVSVEPTADGQSADR
ncbi:MULTISPECIES: endonuclease NucS [Salinibaculum]|uniref:endonuclease NucS n=1 Tax=Salinibaculum TaxID=2732368 RepID=UPI00361795C0